MPSDYDSDISTSDDENDGDAPYGTRAEIGFTAKRRQSQAIQTRPIATPGYWLCCLLPLAFATRYLHATPCKAVASVHELLTVAAVGMCVESLCFFAYLFLDSAIIVKLLVSISPGLITSCLYAFLLHKSLYFALLAGFGITLCYQNIYMRVLRGLPYCFTLGEATVLVQGVLLFAINATYRLFDLLANEAAIGGDFEQINAIMLCALLSLLVFCCLLASVPALRNTINCFALLALLLLVVTCAPVTKPLPIIALFNFILKETKRLYIIAFYLLLVALTVCTVFWQLRNSTRANTRVRKIFHVLIVLVYLPGLLHQCTFLYIASGVALAVFTVLELLRILELPPIADKLKQAFASFKDEKDAGLLALTPFCLLIGCSMPIWLSPCPCRPDGNTLLPLLSGVLAVGFGDTAASVVGSKLGRNKWQNSNRSLEGTAAFIVACLLAVAFLSLLGYLPMTQSKWFATIFATLNTALVEAHTDQIDNLVLPLVFYSLVSLA